jgi:hypothetical protein
MRKFMYALILCLIPVTAFGFCLPIMRTDAVAGQTLAAVGGVEAFFEANWDGMDADDEVCTAGCPDTWDAAAGTATLAVTSNELYFTGDSTDTGYLYIDDDASEVLDGQSITEFWAEFTWDNSGGPLVTSGAGDAIFRWDDTVDGNEQGRIFLYTDGSGDIDGIRLRYTDDNGGVDYACAEQAFAPTDDVRYTFRVHYKKDGDGGADVADTGVFSVVITGGDLGGDVTCEKTDVDNDGAGVLARLFFGLIHSMYDTSNTYYMGFDDFKLYTSDPGW